MFGYRFEIKNPGENQKNRNQKSILTVCNLNEKYTRDKQMFAHFLNAKFSKICYLHPTRFNILPFELI